jgi:hypothetical protein
MNVVGDVDRGIGVGPVAVISAESRVIEVGSNVNVPVRSTVPWANVAVASDNIYVIGCAAAGKLTSDADRPNPAEMPSRRSSDLFMRVPP